MTRKLLEKLCIQAITAEDGDTGLALFEQYKNSLWAVILDLKMPGKDGWQVLDEIRALKANMPAVVFSGFNPERDKRAATYDWLVPLAKPFRLAELESALNQATRGLVS
jgi:putative two-component system response regulator